MIAASRPSGRFAVCCDEAFRLDVRIRVSWCVLVGTVLTVAWCESGAWTFRGSIRLLACCGYRHARERGLLAFYGGLLACGGQALSLRGARPFQREERRWGVKQQVRSVSHDTARFNPAASSPGSSMASPSCRTLVRCTEICPLDLAGLRRIRLLGSRRNDRETLRRWRVAVSSILREWSSPRL